MQFVSVFLASMLAVAPSTALVMRDTMMDGYKVVDLVWTGVVEEGGPVMSFNGTIESIESQVKSLNPNWTIFNSFGPETNTTAGVAKRDMTDLNCKPPGFSQADITPITQGVKYLRGLSGGCNVGGKSCARVSCSYNGAIYLCNNNDNSIAPSCRTLGDYADVILQKCREDSSSCRTGPDGQGSICDWFHMVRGQQWDRGNWNINVRLDQC